MMIIADCKIIIAARRQQNKNKKRVSVCVDYQTFWLKGWLLKRVCQLPKDRQMAFFVNTSRTNVDNLQSNLPDVEYCNREIIWLLENYHCVFLYF